VVADNSGVLKSPKPYVLFEAYGDSCLNFILQVWTSAYIDGPKYYYAPLFLGI
jgi:small-conductance mechanosensitive channel